jgi:hypothetical protein
MEAENPSSDIRKAYRQAEISPVFPFDIDISLRTP